MLEITVNPKEIKIESMIKFVKDAILDIQHDNDFIMLKHSNNVITFDGMIETKMNIVKRLDCHLTEPENRFEDLNPRSFDVTYIGSNLDVKLAVHEYNLRLNKAIINNLEKMTGEIINVSNHLHKRVSDLEAINKKNGLQFYKSAICGILDIIGQEGRIDPEFVKKQMFPEIH